MKQTNLIPLLLLLLSPKLIAATFYLDPVTGSSEGDGSQGSPFGSLESVINENLIESRQWPTPFTKPGKLTSKNPGAPIQAGDTLVLLSGFHGNIELKSFINNDFITIKAGLKQHVTISSINIRGSSKWRIEGLSISPFHAPDYNPATKKLNTIVEIASDRFYGPSANIEIIKNEIFTQSNISSWSAQDWVNRASNGIIINAKQVSVDGNLVKNIRFGISARSNNASIRRNQIINFSADALRGLGDDSLFEYNVIANAFKVDENHDDGFQSFTNARGFEPIHRVTIRNNQFYYDLNHPNKNLISDFQGIGCFDGFFNDWVVENNLLHINHWHAITLMGANNTKIINNTVVDAVPNDHLQPWIRIAPRKESLGGGSGVDNITRNNLARINNKGTGITEDHNMSLILHPLESIFIDPLNNNFQLRNNPLVVDSGSIKQAPSNDIQGYKRDEVPDLGAFEFQK